MLSSAQPESPLEARGMSDRLVAQLPADDPCICRKSNQSTEDCPWRCWTRAPGFREREAKYGELESRWKAADDR
jgi:hypothetical protein